MAKRPVDLLQAATAFYAVRDYDVSYFAATWHSFKVGHLIATDLERVCRNHGISIADFHLMGAMMTEGSARHRATDLAQRLNVSNAVLSSRVKRLVGEGLLLRHHCDGDRRAFELQLTLAGMEVLEAASHAISTQSNFVRCFRALPEADKEALVRIMGELHNQMDRYALSAGRGKT